MTFDVARPLMDYDFDLFVIGAGSGGTRAARVAAQYGARVMIAEEFRVGGTCVIRGCVPKKLMVYASRFADAFEDAAGFGWTVPPATFDWRGFVARKEAEIERLSLIYVANLEKAGVKIADSRATIVDPHHVRLSDGRVVSAGTILVATGGYPVSPPSLQGADLAISSNEIFDLHEFPKRLLVVGGGYIGVEFASIFVRLGARVTLVNRAGSILRGFDEDMSNGVMEALAERGVAFMLGRNLASIERVADGLLVTLDNGTTIACDQVLIATGRAPNTKGLGLDEAGVALGAKGEIRVDPYSQTNIPSIYAVGDVTDRVALTPVAIREGQAFADTVFGKMKIAVDYASIPTAVFTTPEIGTVGLTEREAKATRACVDIYAATFRPMKATLSGRQEKTVMKIVVDANTDLVLGVHVLGEDAGELAQVLGIAVKMGATKADFDATVALHPTGAEELVTMRTRRIRHERPLNEPTGPGMADAVG
jgi:glutathione reductase (NADPH)